MKVIRRILLIFLIGNMVTPALSQGGSTMYNSFIPQKGFVPDERVAIAIAEAVLIAIYGNSQIYSQKPYQVHLDKGVWKINGVLPKDHVGGVFSIEIEKLTGKIIHLSHGR